METKDNNLETLNQRLMLDLKKAMKNKETVEKSVITLLRTGLTAEEKSKKDTLTEQEENEVVLRELKQTKESIEEARKNNRLDVVEKEEVKIDIIQRYLQNMMTEEDIVNFLTEKGAQKGMHLGRIMGMLMKDNKGKVEGSYATEIIEKHFA